MASKSYTYLFKYIITLNAANVLNLIKSFMNQLRNSFVEAPDAGAGQVAYCSQVPWIFEGTLRENIITKSAMHPDRSFGRMLMHHA